VNTDVIFMMIAVWFVALVFVLGIMLDNVKRDITKILDKKINELK
jgi:hypothetical protein